ncbi:hypothetical protein ASPVEDRAFT_269548 [Aspergillus versicolor CBS 583.65]|uniref:Uncharacterized protein n=1 Tax=Aspergillus versicolor CBS 583.65 TaxID=1036611 RepID=A0A1L9P6B4_ASPVE|nr:uncharacterized protein ASPVEDRAFT_269548 [Aspergillus versicolor CBS 583.65]OJI97067.1 hypothetical protein ASPVEDRAFT_269548 [Aspergillus versicolor CBS 583.65]
MTQGEGTSLWNSETCPRLVEEKKKKAKSRTTLSILDRVNSWSHSDASNGAADGFPKCRFSFSSPTQPPTGDRYICRISANGLKYTGAELRVSCQHQPISPPASSQIMGNLILLIVHLPTCPDVYPSISPPAPKAQHGNQIDRQEPNPTLALSMKRTDQKMNKYIKAGNQDAGKRNKRILNLQCRSCLVALQLQRLVSNL